MKNIIHPYVNKEEFDKQVLDLLFLVGRDSVTKFLPSDNIKFDPLEQAKFRNIVHDNWKKAQKNIAEILLQIYAEIAEIDIKIKERNKNRLRDSAKELKQTRKILEIRIRKLRNIFNSIPWAMLGFTDYIPKRFWRNSSDNINRKTLAENFLVIDELNKDPNKMAIMNDLSTFLQVGDMVLLENGYITIGEIKTGKRNHELLNLLLNNVADSKFELTKYDINQMKRIQKQAEVMGKVKKVINTDEGEHLFFDGKVKQLEISSTIEYFLTQINEAYKKLDKSDWSIGCIDDCLYFGLYKNSFIPLKDLPMSIWMKNLSIDGITFRYNDIFYQDLQTPVIISGLSYKFVEDIYTDKIAVYFHLDVLKLISIANDMDINIELVKRNKDIKYPLGTYASYKNHILSIKNGNNDNQILLGNGFYFRMIFDFLSPISALKLNSNVPHII